MIAEADLLSEALYLKELMTMENVEHNSSVYWKILRQVLL
jgi:hypothetical protein